MNFKNIFKSKNREENSAQAKKFNRKNLFKRGSYSLIFAAIALACLIVVNMLFSALGERVSLKVDLTPQRSNTLSDENIEFIKTIKTPVTITVCAERTAYTGGTLANFAAQYLSVEDPDGFFAQTINLIEMYSAHNNNITVKYVDFTGSQGTQIQNKYSNIFYGDLIVSGKDINGVEHEKLVSFNDIYTYEDVYGYSYGLYSYLTITSNMLESALSSAINVVSSGISKSGALLTAYCDTTLFNVNLGPTLKKNGFEISEITDNIISEIPDDIDQLYIVYPQKDMLPEEIEVLNKWLNNNGNRGRSLIFVPSESTANIPNIIEFLQEWGISYSEGILYETQKGKYYSKPTIMYSYSNAETNFTGIPSITGQNCLLGNNHPMLPYYDQHGTKTTEVVYSTADSVVVAPIGAPSTWTPDSSTEKKIYANLIITRDSEYKEDLKSSYVAAFSSYDFLYSQLTTVNYEVAANTALSVTGIDTETQKIFIDKTIEIESFADQLNEKAVSTTLIIFVIIIPISLIIVGVIVWFRRKNR